MKKKVIQILSIALCMVLLSGSTVTANAAKKSSNTGAYQAVFDAEYYYNSNPDLQAAFGYDAQKLFNHFVSSGIYERYYRVNGKIYHHLLSTENGYPIENNLYQVTIISQSSMDGDALSTTCFALGLTDGMQLIEDTDNVEAIFVTDDGEIHYSSGIGKSFQFEQ